MQNLLVCVIYQKAVGKKLKNDNIALYSNCF